MEMKYENSRGKKFIGHLSYGENEMLPYILVIPENLDEEKELVVESLNFEGTNIIDKITPHVIEQLKGMVLNQMLHLLILFQQFLDVLEQIFVQIHLKKNIHLKISYLQHVFQFLALFYF